jgi:hypothetical protein
MKLVARGHGAASPVGGFGRICEGKLVAWGVSHSHIVLEIHRRRPHPEKTITFSEKDITGVSLPHDDALVLSLKINTHRVRHILVDTGSSADVIYFDAFTKMGYDHLHLVKVHTPLVGFTGAAMVPEDLMRMRVEFGTPPQTTSLMIDFLIIKAPPAYNVILGRKPLYELNNNF